MLKFELFHPRNHRFADFTALAHRLNPSAPSEQIDPSIKCLLTKRYGHVVARVSLQDAEGLHGVPQRAGLIGHFEAVDKDAGVATLEEAQRRFKDQGINHVIAPMNDNMWGTYRLSLPHQEGEMIYHPPCFFREPQNPESYPSYFLQAGFNVSDTYQSRIVEDLFLRSHQAVLMNDIAEKAGVTITSLDVDCYDQQLQMIFELCLRAFANNLYYKAIDFETFKSLIAPLKPILDVELVLLAWSPDGELNAFVFAYPDMLSVVGDTPSRLVLKTVASLPHDKNIDLSLILINRIHQKAYEKGYSAVIHALMHDDPVSLGLSKEFCSTLFRRYALYQWTSA